MDIQFLSQVYYGNTVQNYLSFFGLIILAFIFKRLISNLLSKIIFKFFNKFSAGVRAEKFFELLVKPIEFLMVVIIIYIAINQLNYPLEVVVFERKINKSLYTITVIQIIDKIFLTLVIFSAFRILLRIIDFISHVFEHRASLTDSKADDQLVPFMRELLKILTIILGVFVVLGAVFNMNVATIIAGLGIGGLAIALAAQDTLQNLLGSFTIFADKPFVVGDLVNVSGYDGTIEKVGFRSTLLRTMDKTLVIIPNKKMIDSPLENLTLRNLRRVKFNIGILNGTHPSILKSICEEITNYIQSHKETTEDTLVTFDSFGESSLNIQVLYFIEIVEYQEFMKIKEGINYKVMDIVLAKGAKFAYPSRTLYHDFGDNAINVNAKQTS